MTTTGGIIIIEELLGDAGNDETVLGMLNFLFDDDKDDYVMIGDDEDFETFTRLEAVSEADALAIFGDAPEDEATARWSTEANDDEEWETVVSNYVGIISSDAEVAEIINNVTPEIQCRVCHRVVSPANCVTPEPPKVTKTRLLGQGGFGLVALGRFQGRDVAVKELLRGRNPGWLTREADVLDHLQQGNGGHPNVIAMLQRGPDELVFEYGGVVLTKLYIFDDPKSRPLLSHPTDLLRDIVEPLAAGLTWIHSHGVVHHDVKLDNVVGRIGANGAEDVKIIDFGFAEITNQFSDFAGGTPTYTSWEKNLAKLRPAKLYDAKKADAYSFALIMLELHEGRSFDIDDDRLWEHRGLVTLQETLSLSWATMVAHNLVRPCCPIFFEDDHLAFLANTVLAPQHPADRPSMADLLCNIRTALL